MDLEVCGLPANRCLTRDGPPDVCGDFTHIFAEDPGWVGVMKQLLKVSFKRIAAFPEQMRSRAGK
jgi:hypothetical protein